MSCHTAAAAAIQALLLAGHKAPDLSAVPTSKELP